MLSAINAPDTVEKVIIGIVDDPRPRPDQALVDVRAFSVNRGELALLGSRPASWRPGQDVAGVVVEAAADGSGPTSGTRVVGVVDEGGWAQRVAINCNQMASLPDNVDFVAAATLPIAGVTALRTLRIGGDLLGKRVLITAASGAVGRFQVELATARGATVTAVARAAHHSDLRDLGASHLVADTAAAEGLFALVSESLGGQALAAAVSKVEPRGVVVMIGTTSGEPGAVAIYDFIGHEGARLEAFLSYASGPFGTDLELLAAMVAAGKLHPTVGYTGDWSQLPAALSSFAGRQFTGKAVLTIE